jgi:hypothetical protein
VVKVDKVLDGARIAADYSTRTRNLDEHVMYVVSTSD